MAATVTVNATPVDAPMTISGVMRRAGTGTGCQAS